MSDDTQSTNDTTTGTDDGVQAGSDDTNILDPQALQAEIDKWKREARKHEDRWKANQTAVKELEQQKLAAMSDAERAVVEAKAAGRAEAMTELGGRLVEAEFRAAAAGRIGAKQLETLMAALDPGPFVNDDGTPDQKAIARFVDTFAPAQQQDSSTAAGGPGPLDLGQGARGGDQMALNGDPLLNAVKSKLGITG